MNWYDFVFLAWIILMGMGMLITIIICAIPQKCPRCGGRKTYAIAYRRVCIDYGQIVSQVSCWKCKTCGELIGN